VAAYTDPKRPPVGETTFMVEDYVPDRIEFSLTSTAMEFHATRRQQRGRSFPLRRADFQA
jgi:uncharacterized protein YfaS (alpha-2-macroglobulin family)